MSGKQYSRFNDFKKHIDYTYPHDISRWRGLPSDVDGVFLWSDSYLYAFKGNDYYRFNHTTQAVIPEYPKKITSYWKGIPNNIDAVFR